MRIRPEELERIDQLAKMHDMSRTRYVVCMALGEMPDAKTETMERIEALEERLNSLERLAELSSSSY